MDALDRLTERLRRARALHRRSVRRRQGRFLVEGPQGVREAVRHAARHVREMYLTPEAAQRHPEILRADVPLQLVTAEVMRALSADAQGVLAVVDAAAVHPPADLFRGARLVAVLAEVADPGNAGTVIRTADAAGADGVVLVGGSVELTSPKVIRSTAGSVFHVPVVTGAQLSDVVGAARAVGLQVLAADAAGPHDLHELAGTAPAGGRPSLGAPTVWLFGNEAHGLADADRELADASVRVPVYGQAESLNLAAAAAVCLYASAGAQHA